MENYLKKSIFSPFKTQVTDKNLNITIVNCLRDAPWAAYFGELQEAIRTNQWNGNYFEKINLDFSYCEWADPTPLLSILISLAEFKKDKRGKVGIVLPNTNNYPKKKFLKFLSQEGFTKLLIDHSDLILDDEKEIKESFINEHKKLPVNLTYLNSSLLPALILYVEDKDNIEKEVEGLIKRTESIISGKVPRWAEDNIIYRLKVFLRETLLNVYEHAYKNNKGFAGIYVRFRDSQLYSSILTKEGKKALDDEANHDICPCLKFDSFNERAGCIEIFLVDCGIGLTDSLREKYFKSNSKPPKYLLPYLCNLLYCRRNRDELKKVKVLKSSGGLFQLGLLFEQNNDYIRGLDTESWYGTKVPIVNEDVNANRRLSYGKEYCNYFVKGLFWTAWLYWRNHTDIIEDWMRLKEQDNEHIIKEYKKNRTNIDVEHLKIFYVDDQRFENSTSLKLKEPQTYLNNYYLLLPKLGMVKYDITKLIEMITNKISDGKKIDLIIADIPSHEGAIYYNTFNEKDYNIDKDNKFSDKINSIILVSKRLSACVLSLSSNKNKKHFKSNQKESKDFISNKNHAFNPTKSLAHLIRLLRFHDSFVFWKHIINSHRDQNTYIKGEIHWNTDITLSGYLDIVKTLTDTFLRNLYYSNLQRLPGLFPEKSCNFIPMDDLVDSLVNEFNTKLADNEEEKNIKILIGSVMVSGLTEKIATMTKQADFKAYYFFCYPNNKINTSNEINHLFLWFEESIFSSFLDSGSYERIARSAVIAKGGVDYFYKKIL